MFDFTMKKNEQDSFISLQCGKEIIVLKKLPTPHQFQVNNFTFHTQISVKKEYIDADTAQQKSHCSGVNFLKLPVEVRLYENVHQSERKTKSIRFDYDAVIIC